MLRHPAPRPARSPAMISTGLAWRTLGSSRWIVFGPRQAWTTPALPPIAEVRRGQVPTDPGSMSRATASTPPMRATTPASWAGRQASGRYEECWHAARGLALLGGGCRLGVVGVARVRVVDHEDRGVEDRRGQHHHGQQPE